jgi:hypothetical protein
MTTLRAPLTASLAVTGGAPHLRAPLTLTEAVTGGQPKLRAALVVVQAVIPIPEPLPVATLVFPALRGQTYPVKKTAEFNTGVRRVTSGRRTATAFRQFPIWRFEVVFDYLPDRNPGSAGYTDYRTLQSFFLQMQGQFGLFLFRDSDDNHVVGGTIATADGVTLQWPFVRSLNGAVFSETGVLSAGQPEPVGQIDRSTLVQPFASSVANIGTSQFTVVNHGLATGQGPLFIANNGGSLPTPLAASTSYWAISVDANHFQLAASKANALALTPITLTAIGSGNHSITKGVAIYDNGALLGPSSYSITLPNQLVFASAPTSGHAITADFDFWFVCAFSDDKVDFDKFMNQLWQLEKLDFESVIQ